jgi:hypothetical protein
MPFTPPPQVPNFNFGVGRIATDRYDFEAHLEGINPPPANAPKQNFRHQANQIDLSPAVTIAGNPYTTVQNAINILGTLVVPTPPPPATPTTLGLVKLAGDITGVDGNSVVVSGLRGRPIANLAPVTGNVLTFNGTNWTPANTISGNLGVTGSINTTGLLTVSGGITLPASQTFTANTGSFITINGFLTINNNASITGSAQIQVQSGSNIVMESGSFLFVNTGAILEIDGVENVISGGVLNIQSGGALKTNTILPFTGSGSISLQETTSLNYVSYQPWQGSPFTQMRSTLIYQGVVSANATTSATTVLSVPLPVSFSGLTAQVYFNAKNTSTPGNVDSGLSIITAYNNSGTLSQKSVFDIGSFNILQTQVVNGSTPIVVTSSGTNLLIQVKNNTSAYNADWQVIALVSIN